MSFGKIKCFFGRHAKLVFTGAGFGSATVMGKEFGTECRTWKCPRCGAEFGTVNCEELPEFGTWHVSAEFVRKTSLYNKAKGE